MAQRSFKLSDELDSRLIAIADADGRSVSNLIVKWLEAYARAYEQAPPMPENLRETARGEIVAADPSKPVRYEQKYTARTTPAELAGLKNFADEALKELERQIKRREPPTRREEAQAKFKELGEGTPLPKIAPRRAPR